MAKPRTIRNKDGSVTTRRADGSESTKYRDGSTVTKDTDGTVTTHHRDGSEVIVSPDGVRQVFDKHGNILEWVEADGTVNAANKDGSLTIIKPDGTETIVYKDESMKTTSPDGTVTTNRADGTDVVVSPNGDTKTTYTDGRVVQSFHDGTHMVTKPDGTSVFTSTNGNVVTGYPDGRTTVTQPDGTVWTDLPDGTKTVRLPDGTVRTNMPGFEVTNEPDGRVHMSFPGGVELDISRDGTPTWGSSEPSAMLDADGFVDDRFAAMTISPSDDGRDPTTDVIGDIDGAPATANGLKPSDDAGTNDLPPTGTDVGDVSDDGGLLADRLSTLRAAELDGVGDGAADDVPASDAGPGGWSTDDDPVFGSTTDTVAQTNDDDSGTPSDERVVEPLAPPAQFVAEASAIDEGAVAMTDDFETSAVTVPTDLATDEELS